MKYLSILGLVCVTSAFKIPRRLDTTLLKFVDTPLSDDLDE